MDIKFYINIKPLVWRLVIIFCLISMKCIGDTGAIAKEFTYTNFTTRDGLPSNEVYTIFQDSKGYIWIGTDRGVSKYDGYSFKTYTTQDGLTDNVVFGIAEDSKGQIWFTTFNRTLCYMDTLGSIHSYSYNFKIKNILNSSVDDGSNVYFDQIYIDKNDHLYLSNKGVGYFDIPLKEESHSIKFINPFTEDKQIAIILTENYKNIFVSPFVLNTGDGYLSINNHIVDSICNTSSEVWNQSYVLKDSMFYFNSKTYKVIDSQSVQINSYNRNIHALRTKKGLFVNQVGSRKGHGHVYLIESNNKRTKVLNKKIRLTGACQDLNNGIWLSSIENGIFYLPNLNHKVIIPNYNTKVIIPYGNNQVLFSERKQKFNIYDLIDGEIKIGNDIVLDSLFTRIPVNIKLSHSIRSSYLDHWVNAYKTFSSAQIEVIFSDSNQVILASVSKLLAYNKSEGITSLFHKSEIGKIYCFGVFPTGQIIFGYKDGLAILTKDGYENYLKTDINFKWKPKDLKIFKNSQVVAVATTGNGLYLFKNGELIQQLSIDDGLVSNTINQLVLDHNDRLWVATNKGVNYIDMVSDTTYIVNSLLSSSRSLTSPFVQQIHVLNDSILLIGTDKGINEVNISTIEYHESLVLPIYLTSIVVNDSLSLKKELNFDENNIVFHFTALEFNQFGNLQYRYRLNGQFDDWIYTKERKATFMSLPSGEYNFQLEVQNEFGDWVSLKSSPNFKIKKPYWKTWWFIGGGVLVGFFIIGGVLYFYISNLKKEKAFVEKEQVLSEELNESRQKALSAQLNPHFVFNSLNSIQNFILTKRTELSSDYLSTFSKLMRFVFENSKKLYVPLTDEMEALRLYLELEQVRHNHNFEFKIQAQELNTNSIFIPSLLIQPMIENAIWHGLLHKEENDRWLEVNFRSNKEYLLIEVKDNGVGRGGSKPRPKFIKKQRSSGVELTKQRLDLLSQSTGLKTSFEIEDLYDENEKPIGTLVIISIPLTLSL